MWTRCYRTERSRKGDIHVTNHETTIVYVAASSNSWLRRLSPACGGLFRMEGEKQTVPDFELTAIDGAKVRLSHYRGRPVVLAFWSHH